MQRAASFICAQHEPGANPDDGTRLGSDRHCRHRHQPHDSTQVIPKLSICIPTRNRARYLEELLESLKNQQDERVEVVVSDNASSDKTNDVCARYANLIPGFRYYRNTTNIGAVPNLRQVMRMARGEWVWPMGDDELLGLSAVSAAMLHVTSSGGGLIVLKDGHYNDGYGFGGWPNIGRLTEILSRSNPHAILERTLISLNIFKRTDIGDGHALFNTPFEHMAHMDEAGRDGVLVTALVPISTRKRRPPAVDGEWPDLEKGWRQYLEWLKRWHYAGLDVDAVLATVPKRKARQIIRNPIGYVRDNIQSLTSWSGIKWAAKRVISYIK